MSLRAAGIAALGFALLAAADLRANSPPPPPLPSEHCDDLNVGDACDSLGLSFCFEIGAANCPNDAKHCLYCDSDPSVICQGKQRGDSCVEGRSCEMSSNACDSVTKMPCLICETGFFSMCEDLAAGEFCGPTDVCRERYGESCKDQLTSCLACVEEKWDLCEGKVAGDACGRADDGSYQCLDFTEYYACPGGQTPCLICGATPRGYCGALQGPAFAWLLGLLGLVFAIVRKMRRARRSRALPFLIPRDTHLSE